MLKECFFWNPLAHSKFYEFADRLTPKSQTTSNSLVFRCVSQFPTSEISIRILKNLCKVVECLFTKQYIYIYIFLLPKVSYFFFGDFGVWQVELRSKSLVNRVKRWASPSRIFPHERIFLSLYPKLAQQEEAKKNEDTGCAQLSDTTRLRAAALGKLL